jgi:hypothetical protein
MTPEQIQNLTQLTEQAVDVSDMESLVKIYQIILQDLKDDPFQPDEGPEWFWLMIPTSWWEGIQTQAQIE